MSKFIYLSILLFSCHSASTFDAEKARKEILQLEAQQREYHFNKNAKDFVDLFSKDFQSINRGVISYPTSSDSYQRFDNYFKSVEFIKWDDLQVPVIRFSDDGSIAYSAVDKLVILKAKKENGGQEADTTHFAWLTVYKKTADGWKIDCVASTNK